MPNPLRQSSWTCALLSAERRTSPYFSFSLPSALTQREKREIERDRKEVWHEHRDYRRNKMQTISYPNACRIPGEYRSNVISRVCIAVLYCLALCTFLNLNNTVQILLKLCHFVAINVNISENITTLNWSFISLVRMFSQNHNFLHPDLQPLLLQP